MTMHLHDNQDILDAIVGADGVQPAAVAKGWVNFTGTGTVTINDSFNVSSITDNGTGNYTVNWDIDFDNADYAPVCISIESQTIPQIPSVGTVGIVTRNTAGTNTDASRIYCSAFGDNSNLSVGGSAPGVKIESLCKGWVQYTSVTTTTIADSFNVTSLTDNGTGDTTINWDVDFDNIDYSAAPAANIANCNVANPLVGSLDVLTTNSSDAATDASVVMLQAFGDNPIALSREAGYIYGDVDALVDAATVAPDSRDGDTFTLTPTQSFTLNTPTNVPAGKSYKCDIFITQDGTGSRVLTVGAGWLVESGTDPVLTTDPAAVDWLVATYNGSSWFLGMAMGDAS